MSKTTGNNSRGFFAEKTAEILLFEAPIRGMGEPHVEPFKGYPQNPPAITQRAEKLTHRCMRNDNAGTTNREPCQPLNNIVSCGQVRRRPAPKTTGNNSRGFFAEKTAEILLFEAPIRGMGEPHVEPFKGYPQNPPAITQRAEKLTHRCMRNDNAGTTNREPCQPLNNIVSCGQVLTVLQSPF